MKLNPSVTYSFSVLLLILLLFGGCGEEEEMTGPEIVTVKIEFTLVGEAGEAGTLGVIISADYVSPSFDSVSASFSEAIYNTKHEFALTESFSQDFPLDPDDPSLAVEITNNTPHDLSVHLTVLVDGEVEADERESFTSRSRAVRWWTWSTTNE